MTKPLREWDVSGLFAEKKFRRTDSRPPIRWSNGADRPGMTKALGKMCPKQKHQITMPKYLIATSGQKRTMRWALKGVS